MPKKKFLNHIKNLISQFFKRIKENVGNNPRLKKVFSYISIGLKKLFAKLVNFIKTAIGTLANLIKYITGKKNSYQSESLFEEENKQSSLSKSKDLLKMVTIKIKSFAMSIAKRIKPIIHRTVEDIVNAIGKEITRLITARFEAEGDNSGNKFKRVTILIITMFLTLLGVMLASFSLMIVLISSGLFNVKDPNAFLLYGLLINSILISVTLNIKRVKVEGKPGILIYRIFDNSIDGMMAATKKTIGLANFSTLAKVAGPMAFYTTINKLTGRRSYLRNTMDVLLIVYFVHFLQIKNKPIEEI